MIPWVREKLAESRIRWQNRKQRNDSPTTTTSNSSVSSSHAQNISNQLPIPVAAVSQHNFYDRTIDDDPNDGPSDCDEFNRATSIENPTIGNSFSSASLRIKTPQRNGPSFPHSSR